VEKFFGWQHVAYPVSTSRCGRAADGGEPYEKYFYAGWRSASPRSCAGLRREAAEEDDDDRPQATNIYGRTTTSSSHVARHSRADPQVRRALEPLEVWGDGSEVRDVIYVDDMVEAMLLARRDFVLYPTISSGKGTPSRRSCATSLRSTAIGCEVRSTPRSPPRSVRLIDTHKAQSLLEFRAKVDCAKGSRGRSIGTAREKTRARVAW